MENFSEIISKIKKLKNVKKDGDVAKLLGLEVKNFSSYKARNVIPTDVIVEFCGRENVSLNWLFFNFGPPSLRSEEEFFATLDDPRVAYIVKWLTTQNLVNTFFEVAKIELALLNKKR